MRLLLFIGIFFFGCGDYYEGQDNENKPDSQEYIAIKPLIVKNCGECHNGSNQKKFDNEQRFLSSQAKARIKNGSMPQGKKLSTEDKQKFLDYFGSEQ